jgi:hypothetical protein
MKFMIFYKPDMMALVEDTLQTKGLCRQHTPLLVNGHQLQVYNKPRSKEEFSTRILQNSDMQMISKEGDLPTNPH